MKITIELDSEDLVRLLLIHRKHIKYIKRNGIDIVFPIKSSHEIKAVDEFQNQVAKNISNEELDRLISIKDDFKIKDGSQN